MSHINVKNFSRYLALVPILAATLLLQACIFGGNGYIHNRSDDYQHARSLPAPTLPTGVSATKLKPAYRITGENSNSVDKKPDLVPPGFSKSVVTSSSKAGSVQLINQPYPRLVVRADITTTIGLISKAVQESGWLLVNSDEKNGVLVIKEPKHDEMYLLQAVSENNTTTVTPYNQTSDKVTPAVAEYILSTLKQHI
jgi:uncharacterized lipoprotein